MLILWIMVAGVIPLWMVMTYGLDLPLYQTMLVAIMYFALFTVLLTRYKRKRIR